MKKIILLIICSFFLLIPFVNAEENELQKESTTENTKKSKKDGSVTPDVESSILLEASTGKILYKQNENKRLAPASMTKVMTLLLAMERIENGSLKLNEEVLISKNASAMGGSQVFLDVNSKLTVENALKAIGIASANDASVAMAEKIAGSEEKFVELMNKRAKELGANNTTFKNAHGLDEDGHLTTAKDLALISKELVKHDRMLKISNTYEDHLKVGKGKEIWLVNTNKLLRFYEGMDGLKTGYTPKAGYSIIVTAKKKDMRLIGVVMKGKSQEARTTNAISLLEYGYSMYSTNTILKKNKKMGKISINKSKERLYNYYLADDVKLVASKDNSKVDYDYKIKLNNLVAPLNKNSKVGKLILTQDGKKIEYDLKVRKEVKKATYFNLLGNNFKDIISGRVNVFN